MTVVTRVAAPYPVISAIPSPLELVLRNLCRLSMKILWNRTMAVGRTS